SSCGTSVAAALRMMARGGDWFNACSGVHGALPSFPTRRSSDLRRGRRIGVFLLDEEVMYQSSVEQVEYLMGMFPEATKRMWLQVPFYLTNATSLVEGQLQCWEPGEHKKWMRPKRADAVKAKPWGPEHEKIGNAAKGFGFYDAIAAFERLHAGAAFLVGLRAAGESPNRWRAVVR